jgi:hypothetical protein
VEGLLEPSALTGASLEQARRLLEERGKAVRAVQGLREQVRRVREAQERLVEQLAGGKITAEAYLEARRALGERQARLEGELVVAEERLYGRPSRVARLRELVAEVDRYLQGAG